MLYMRFVPIRKCAHTLHMKIVCITVLYINGYASTRKHTEKMLYAEVLWYIELIKILYLIVLYNIPYTSTQSYRHTSRQ